MSTAPASVPLASPASIQLDLTTPYAITPGYKRGWLTAVRKVSGGKWLTRCICGTELERSCKAMRNPLNEHDACTACRREVYLIQTAHWRATQEEHKLTYFMTTELEAKLAGSRAGTAEVQSLLPPVMLRTSAAVPMTTAPGSLTGIMLLNKQNEIVPAPAALTSAPAHHVAISRTATKPLASLSRRERLWHEAAGLCHWCGILTKLCNSPLPDQATIDHVVPRCRGGADTLENCVNSCNRCNAKRNEEDMRVNGPPTHPGANALPKPQRFIKAADYEAARQQRDSALAEVRKLQGLLGGKTAELHEEHVARRAAEKELAGLKAMTLRDWLRLWLVSKLLR